MTRRMHRRAWFGGWAALSLLTGAVADPPATRYFVIRVLDQETGRGVPLVELRTVNAVSYFTDSAGVAAIDEPSLVGRKVHFQVSSHGYEAAADGFGFRGAALKVEPGASATVRIRRINIAERLYRLTGEGIYRDSQLAGLPVPGGIPPLRAGILGCDSVQTATYRGRLFWLWGDTNRAEYPLGNFHMTGATTSLQASEARNAGGVLYEYFTGEDGFARGVAPVPGPGPTWLDGLIALGQGPAERLFAAYSKIKDGLKVYERGLVSWDDAAGQFRPVAKFPSDAPIYPFGHPVKVTDGGREWVYFGDPFLLVRAPAAGAALSDLSTYEAFTCLKEGSSLSKPVVDRDASGRARYAWRRAAPSLDPVQQEALIKNGTLKREEAHFQLRGSDGRPVVLHRGTVRWNGYRKKWIVIATEIGGSSNLGEVWYLEGASMQGPWSTPIKIISHRRYSFYNPVHHPEFDEAAGRFIYLEGTYTHTFSGNPIPTPRYDYNQVMYRLDLADPRLRGKPGPDRSG